MPKKPPKQPGTSNPHVLNPIAQGAQQISPLTHQQQVQVVGQFYQGPVPPAEELARYEAILPGAADRIIAMAESEVEHRRMLEKAANDANIAAQQKQLEIAEIQARSVFSSDRYGQWFGAILSVVAIIGAIYLSINGHEGVAGVIAAFPTAAIIRAFRDPPAKPKQDVKKT